MSISITKGDGIQMKDILLKNKKFVIITFILTLFTAVLTVSVPILLSNIFNNNYTINTQNFILIIVFMFITYAIQIAMVIIRENFALKFNTDYSKELFSKMFNMKYDSILNQGSSYLIDRIGQVVNNLYLFLINSLVGIISNVIIIIVSLILIALINIYLFLMLLALVPINYLGYKFINKKLHEKSKIMQEDTSSGYKELIAIFKNTDMIKQESDYKRIENLISPSIERIYRSMANVNKYGQSTSLIIKLLNNFVQNLMFFALAYLIFTGDTQVGDLVIASIVLPIFFTALQAFTNVNLEYRDLLVSKDFVEESIINEQEEHKDIILKNIESIHFGNVDFNIAKKSISHKINNTFTCGDIVYVNGPSGSGKSSLMKSLLKFRDSSGIRINEYALEDINIESLRSHIFYLSQETSVLPFTLKENIAYGSEDSHYDWNSLQNSELMGSILKNHSLDGKLLDQGSNLSGGEKQRVMLARLLNEDYDVIVLDEVTSNIDKKSQEIILDTVLKRMKNKIVFMISHDLTVKEFCNKEIKINL